jgi:TM2 domain-containing membrane protein YozV
MRERSSATIIDLGPYGTIDETASSSKDLQKDEDVPYFLHQLAHWGILGAHVLACGGAGVIIWSTIDLAIHGVVTWACWTSFYPVIWLALAIANYFGGVVTIRHSLKLPTRVTCSPNDANETFSTHLVPINGMEHPRSHVPSTGSTGRTEARLEGDRHPLPDTQPRFDDEQTREARPCQSVAKSALSVLDLKPGRFADVSKACVDLLDNAIYLYGTAIFSSLTMVRGHNAIRVLCIYASVAVVSRVITEWVLEGIGGAD